MEILNNSGHLLNFAGSSTLQYISQTAANTLVSTVWQSILLAVFLRIAIKIAPHSTAKLRFSLWAAAFGAILCLPFLPAVTRMLVRGAGISVTASSQLASTSAKPWFIFDIRWSVLIVGVWAFASFYRAADLTRHALRLRKLWKSAKPVNSITSIHYFTWHKRRDAQLCVTEQLEKPSVIGFFSPRILIPSWLFDRLSPVELQQVILHETEHLARLDDWTNLVQKLSLVLFPLNPVLLWIDRQLGREREMACDDGVVQRTQAPRAYATCLANLAERNLQHRTESLSLGAWDRRSELARRVHRILLSRPALSPAAASSILAILSAGLMFGSFELSRCPQLVAFVPNVPPSGTDGMADAGTRIGNGHIVRASYLDRSQRIQSQANQTLSRIYLNHARKVDVTEVLGTTERAHLGVTTRSEPASTAKANHEKMNANVSSGFIAENAMTPDSETTPEQQAFIAQPLVAKQSGEQWVVLTTWRETVADNSGASNSQPPEVAGSAQTVDSKQFEPQESSASPISQTTITRMIFRIVPASYRLPNPAPVPEKSKISTSNATGGSDQVPPARADLNVPRSPRDFQETAPIRSGWFFLKL